MDGDPMGNLQSQVDVSQQLVCPGYQLSASHGTLGQCAIYGRWSGEEQYRWGSCLGQKPRDPGHRISWVLRVHKRLWILFNSQGGHLPWQVFPCCTCPARTPPAWTCMLTTRWPWGSVKRGFPSLAAGAVPRRKILCARVAWNGDGEDVGWAHPQKRNDLGTSSSKVYIM